MIPTYTGITNNIEKRLMEHQIGIDKSSYTFSRKPVELVFCQPFNNIISAIEQEKRIKRWTRKKKEALIEGNWEKLRDFAECLNESSHKNFEGYPSTPLTVKGNWHKRLVTLSRGRLITHRNNSTLNKKHVAVMVS